MPQRPPNISPGSLVCGIDEAGRGCLAGPVVAAAVVLPPDLRNPGLADSKKLSPGRRERLKTIIKESAIAWSIGVVWPGRIDKINILNATFEAMAKAAASIKTTPQMLLIDGNKTIPISLLANVWQNGREAPRQEAIVGGDAKIPAISAASILAKTFRDRLMLSLARRWPGYGFEQHKGYGTKRHLEALVKLGPTSMHRLTFRGVIADKQPLLL